MWDAQGEGMGVQCTGGVGVTHIGTHCSGGGGHPCGVIATGGRASMWWCEQVGVCSPGLLPPLVWSLTA